ncbi:hypothetical protein CPB83DRAFT_840866 [Crepidotus variabilis]|uniref:Uncharacterized protein n=1 Tax=Crepidotus variabilis TaxID=179855 RepID=A0A9P6E3N1_9AGAR|nr:hypothetical protein CPB83DRAFT_840866 [Crepidotus variabilis]
MYFASDPAFLQLAQFRAITNIQLLHPIGHSKIKTSLENLCYHGQPDRQVTTLVLTFSFRGTEESILALWALGKTLHGVKNLIIYCQSLNALAISQFLLEKPLLFLNLQSFGANITTAETLTFQTKISHALILQKSHLYGISRSRVGFVEAQFGPVQWAQTQNGRWQELSNFLPRKDSRLFIDDKDEDEDDHQSDDEYKHSFFFDVEEQPVYIFDTFKPCCCCILPNAAI